MRPIFTIFALLLPLSVSACGGAGAYGHARTYEPSSAEESVLETTRAASYEEVRRAARNFAGQTVSFFGVVRHLEPGEDGVTQARVELRVLQPRNLCADETASSCRVTVSERNGGLFTALLHVRPQDQQGQRRLAAGSLVRVYGTPTGDLDEDDGLVLEVSYYRQWPHSQYVTTGAAVRMRR